MRPLIPRKTDETSPVPNPTTPLSSRERTFAWSWLCHGGCLMFLAVLLGPSAEQVQLDSWAEGMAFMGAESYVGPIRTVMPAVAAYALDLGILGCLCVVAAALALWRQQRWALQVMALIHVPLLVVATWWSHQLSAKVLPLGWGDVLGELLLLGLCLGMVGWSLVVFNRPGSASSGSSAPT